MNTSKLSQVLSVKLEGMIWKIEVNEKYDLIAIESRTVEPRKTSFNVINYKTGKILFKEKIFREAWNLNLAYIAQKKINYYGFKSTRKPRKQGYNFCKYSGCGSILGVL